MPDAEESSNWPIFQGLEQLWPQLAGWLQAHLQVPALPTVPYLLPQLAAVLATLVAARLFARRLAPHTRRFVANRAADRQSLLTWLRPAAFPLLWIALLWFAAVALREADAPAKLVEIALGLAAAWVGVRLVASFVASLFWSRVIAVGIVVVVGLKAIGLWSSTLSILDQMALNIGSVRISVLGIIEATLILSVFWWGGSLLTRRLDLWAERLPGLSPSERVLLGKLTSVLAWIFAVFVALHAVGINLTTLAVFSGAVGLGVGFGLQKVCSNLISGVILLLDRSVKPGDVIAVGEHYGWINALGARYVSVVTRDGIEHLIPNEDLISDRVENWSHSNNLLRLRATGAGRATAALPDPGLWRQLGRSRATLLDQRSARRRAQHSQRRPEADLGSLPGERHRAAVPAARPASEDRRSVAGADDRRTPAAGLYAHRDGQARVCAEGGMRKATSFLPVCAKCWRNGRRIAARRLPG